MRDTSSQSSSPPSIDAADLDPVPTGGRAHSVWRERLIAGVASGTLVLCWFVLFDWLTVGTPWHTAERIGAALARFVIGGSPTLGTSLVFFCVLHYGVWVFNASLVLGIVHRGKKHPTIVVPALLLSAILFVPFIGVIAMLVEIGWGSGTWARFILAALIGGVMVATQAYRAHPGLVRYELAHIDDEE